MYEMPKIPNVLDNKTETVEVRKVEPKIILWTTVGNCDFVYKSNGMLKGKIDGKWKIIYHYIEPEKVYDFGMKFESGEITKEDLLNDKY